MPSLKSTAACKVTITATFRGGDGHFCGRVARFATRQGLLDVPAQTLLLSTEQVMVLVSHGDALQIAQTAFARIPVTAHRYFISPKVFLKSFCRSQLPSKSVNLSFTINDMKNKLTDLCGN